MVHLYYSVSQRYVSSYDKLTAFPPCPAYLFQFVGVYPWFQHFFVLFKVLGGKCSYEQLVGEYRDVLTIRGPLIIVRSSGKSIRMAIVFPRYVLQLDVVLF